MTNAKQTSADDGRAYWGDSDYREDGDLVEMCCLTLVYGRRRHSAVPAEWLPVLLSTAGGNRTVVVMPTGEIDSATVTAEATVFTKAFLRRGNIVSDTTVIAAQNVVRAPQVAALNHGVPDRAGLFLAVELLARRLYGEQLPAPDQIVSDGVGG